MICFLNPAAVSCHATILCNVAVQVDGLENPKVQSVFFADTPLHKAAFANDGAQVEIILLINATLLTACHICCALHGTYREVLRVLYVKSLMVK